MAARQRCCRALYSRRIQRSREHWSLDAPAGRLLIQPELVLRALCTTAPVERGRPGAQPGRPGPVGAGQPVRGGSRDQTGRPPRSTLAMRAAVRRTARLAMPVRTDVHVSGRLIPGPEGAPEIPVRVYRQYGSGLGLGGRVSLPAIVYFHGGGWVSGDLDTHDASLPDAGRREPLPGGGGRLPAGPRAPVPGRRRRRRGRLPLGQRNTAELGIDPARSASWATVPGEPGRRGGPGGPGREGRSRRRPPGGPGPGLPGPGRPARLGPSTRWARVLPDPGTWSTSGASISPIRTGEARASPLLAADPGLAPALS